MSKRTIRHAEARIARYPKSEGTARPFRLWDELAWDDRRKAKGKALPHRNYKHPLMAYVGCVVMLKQSPVGAVISIYNATTGKLVEQYKRHAGGVEFREAGKP